MRRIVVFFSLLLIGSSVYSQTQPKYTPAQQKMIDQAMANAKAMQAKMGMHIDMPSGPLDVKPPKLDVKRLAAIPQKQLTDQELRKALSEMKQKLGNRFVNVNTTVQKFTAANNQDPNLLQAASIGVFYKSRNEETGQAGDPVTAILLSLEAAEIQEKVLAKAQEGSAVELHPELIKAVNNLNNLSAILNMSGLADKSIPILNKCLQRIPKHSSALNNMGQAYLALGELKKARQCLAQSLAIDDLNPEANHSMGMISLFENLPEEALRYFNKQLEVALEKNSLLKYAALGKEQALSVLRKTKAKQGKDFFEEINLGEFALKFPEPPMKLLDIPKARAEFMAYSAFGLQESLKWMTMQIPIEEIIAEGKKMGPFNEDVVRILLDDLHNEFTFDYLSVLTYDELQELHAIDQGFALKMKQTKCPEAPEKDPLKYDRLALYDAYQVKCCNDFTAPLYHSWLEAHNGYVLPKLKRSISRWKSYINQLIHFANLAPTGANKLTVYKAMGLYYQTIISAQMMIDNPAPPLECNVKMSVGKANLIIAASKLDFNCPASFYLHAPLKVIDIKLTCEKIDVEASLGVFVITGSREIKSKKSTIAFGANVEANFFEMMKAGVKHQAFITVNGDGSFADAGFKQEMGAEIALLGKIDGGATVSINAGFQEQPFTGAGSMTGVENELRQTFNDLFVIK